MLDAAALLGVFPALLALLNHLQLEAALLAHIDLAQFHLMTRWHVLYSQTYCRRQSTDNSRERGPGMQVHVLGVAGSPPWAYNDSESQSQ